MVSGILDFGIGNSAQGIRNPTNDWNPERVRNPVPEIPWITLCGAKSSSGCLETSGRGYRIDRREDDCKRDELLGKTFSLLLPNSIGIFLGLDPLKLCFLRSQEHEPDELSSKKTKDQLYLRKEIQKHLN